MSPKRETKLPDTLIEPLIPEAPLDAPTAEGIILILDELRRRAHARYWTTKRRSVGNTDPVLRGIGGRISTIDDVIAAVSSYLSAGQAGAGSLYRHAKVVARCPRCRARARINPATIGHVRKSPTLPPKPSQQSDDATHFTRPFALPDPTEESSELDDLPF